MTDSLLLDLIKKIPTVQADYTYANEKSINPAYCDLEHAQPLCPDEKKIWVLRGDLIFAIGNKNTYVELGNTDILTVIELSLHKYIDLSDRYGHPSLTLPEGDYDGSAYYAGWLYQNINRIELLLYSGRYQNMKISRSQQCYLERYISQQLMNTYGEQDIIFYDFEKEEELEVYLQGDLFSSSVTRRVYTPDSIQNKSLLDFLIENNYEKTAIELFELGAIASSPINGRRHMIHLLSKKGYFNHVKMLILDDPTLVHLKDADNKTPLLWASARGQNEIVSLLIANNAEVNVVIEATKKHKKPTHNKDHSPLDAAIENGHTTTAWILIKAQAKANYTHTISKDKNIDELIKKGDLFCLQMLINQNHALLNKKNKHGYAPIHTAAHNGKDEIVNYLITEDVDIDLSTDSVELYENIFTPQMTVLTIAEICGNVLLVIYLLKMGATMSPGINGIEHIIHVFAKKGFYNEVIMLINQAPELIHIKDAYHRTPLSCAAASGHNEIVSFLISKKAEVNSLIQQPGNKNVFPLDLAIQNGHKTTAWILSKAGGLSASSAVKLPIEMSMQAKDKKGISRTPEICNSIFSRDNALNQEPKEAFINKSPIHP